MSGEKSEQRNGNNMSWPSAAVSIVFIVAVVAIIFMLTAGKDILERC